MAETTEADILKAVNRLDDKLSKALRDQTDTLTKSIQELADRHTDALIEQEKRNATFAPISRVEAVAKNLHDLGTSVLKLTLQREEMVKSIATLEAKGGVTWSKWTTVAAIISGPTVYLVSLLVDKVH